VFSGGYKASITLQQLLTHTAHEFPTSLEAFIRERVLEHRATATV